MNRLSWFLYLSEVLQNIRTFTSFILFMIGFLGGIGLCIITLVSIFENTKLRPLAKTIWRWWAAVVIPFAIITALIPSQNMLYAIAASEIGERVVKHDAVQGVTSDATKALQQWIKRQLEPETKK